MGTKTEELHAIVKRLDMMEKQNRWLRRFLAVPLLVFAFFLLTAQSRVPARRIEAQEFVLVNASGRRLAVLQSVDGWPGLDLLSPSGSLDASLALGAQGPSLIIGDPKKEGRIGLTSYKGFGPSIDIASPKEGAVASFGFSNNSPQLFMGRSEGGDQASISVEDEGPSVVLKDKEGFQVHLGVTSTVITKTGQTQKTSAASLVLFGKDGKVLWSIP